MVRVVEVHDSPNLQTVSRRMRPLCDVLDWAYASDDLIQKLNEVLNVRELEGGEPATVVALDLVVDDNQKADKQVCCNQAAKTDESFLADADPWRVADAKEDGLAEVSIGE